MDGWSHCLLIRDRLAHADLMRHLSRFRCTLRLGTYITLISGMHNMANIRWYLPLKSHCSRIRDILV